MNAMSSIVNNPGNALGANTRRLHSVGIDVGTTTTQVIFSALEVTNRAPVNQVPRYEFSGREILYQSPVIFTPLTTDRKVDVAQLMTFIDAQYAAAGLVRSQIESGAIIITGETSKTRNAALPTVPTMVESGMKNYDLTGWYALIGPQKMPADVVDKLVKAQKAVGDDPAFQQRMTQGGYDLNITGPKPLADRIQRELKLWGGVVKTANIQVD